MRDAASETIYLDHNATTPLLPEVAEAMRACWDQPLNPASQHEYGRRARRLIEAARERIAQLLGAETTGRNNDLVIFTSGGTEANNLAVRGIVGHGAGNAAGHAIISSIEHPSVSSLAGELMRERWRVDRLAVDPRGQLRVDHLLEIIRPDTRLIASMLGQNETGVLQPVAELATIAARHGVPIHCDAAQVAGKLPISFRSLGVTTMTIAAHKFHGPLGIGALVVRHGTPLQPQLFGGFQQSGLRPGTELVALAVGMCRALELWGQRREERASRLAQLRDRFEQAIVSELPIALVIGAEAPRLPHTSLIAFRGFERQSLFMALDQAGVACSTGSACASGSSERSPVLIAMGCDLEIVDSALRFSFGATTTDNDIDEAARRILRCCKELERQKRY